MRRPLCHTALFVLVTFALVGCGPPPEPNWSEAEAALIQSLSLASRPPLPPSVGNQVADDPAAAKLGHALFFDARLSANGAVACANCHKPELFFTDGLALSVGVATADRNAMSLLGAAYSPWLFWDGRKDSLWAQALAPLENPVEHGTTRMQVVRHVFDHYRGAYEALFGDMPAFDAPRFPRSAAPIDAPEANTAWQRLTEDDQHAVNTAFANIGKTLDAYQRKLRHGPTRFDAYAASLAATGHGEGMSAEEQAGLRLFIGDAQCINCHNGWQFTNNDFHNTAALSVPGQLPSKGRSDAIDGLLADPFNCQGAFSDAHPNSCLELRFMKTGDELIGGQRTPSLRNAVHTAPYLHAGQVATLAELLRQYNEAPTALVGHNEAKPLELTSAQLGYLEAFLHTLSGAPGTDDSWLKPPAPQLSAR